MPEDSKPAKLLRAPIYLWILASYPAVQLLSHNIDQVGIEQVIRPLLASWLIATALYILFRAVLRDQTQAALSASLILVLFFSYGHLYQLLRESPVLAEFGRHRHLVAAYGIALIVGFLLLLRTSSWPSQITSWLNALATVLLLMPILQIGSFGSEQARVGPESTEQFESSQRDDHNRDIYYIVLDAYTRGDSLQEEFGYDNSPFLNNLERIGFFVADCARSNYAHTDWVLTTALNMEYMTDLQDDLIEQGLDPAQAVALLKNSAVRYQLENLGYKTVAFQTGYDWTNWRDADVYLSAALHPLSSGKFSAFEMLFFETTLAKFFLDTRYSLALSDDHDVGIRYGGHIELQTNILDQLPGVVSISDPTFTFAHILIPHLPYVFGPDGEIRSDPRFFSGEGSTAINDHYELLGYTGGVEFVNGRILEIVESIIADSDPEPIIIIQGDHGLREDDRLKVLSAFYFPDTEISELYDSITHVNTFRLLFDRYFETELGLLPDLSFHEDGDPLAPVPETAHHCIDS